MSKEFTYHQRPPDNRKEFERRYENIFRKQAQIETDKASKSYNKKVTDMVFRTRVGNKAETTEQKQPNE